MDPRRRPFRSCRSFGPSVTSLSCVLIVAGVLPCTLIGVRVLPCTLIRVGVLSYTLIGVGMPIPERFPQQPRVVFVFKEDEAAKPHLLQEMTLHDGCVLFMWIALKSPRVSLRHTFGVCL